jgi:hypothetical protein
MSGRRGERPDLLSLAGRDLDALFALRADRSEQAVRSLRPSLVFSSLATPSGMMLPHVSFYKSDSDKFYIVTVDKPGEKQGFLALRRSIRLHRSWEPSVRESARGRR